MPSPFPGMDPYVEGHLWASMHTDLSHEIARQLAPRLRPKYVARTTEHFVWEEITEGNVVIATVISDVGITGNSPNGSSSAVGTLTAPLRMATVMPKRVPQVSVEIREVKKNRLVTSIEVLSPTNKQGRGRGQYLKKRRRLLKSSVHLLEIDLLRMGQRVPMVNRLPSTPYFVFLSRAQHRPLTEIWPISMREPLPPVPVPLRGGDADVPLDLQSAFATVYDVFAYDLSIDYAQPPETPLSDDDIEWAAGLLRTHRTGRAS